MNYKARKSIDAVLSGEIDTLKLYSLYLIELSEEIYKLTIDKTPFYPNHSTL